MTLFLEEENRHKDVLAMCMRYIYYRSNFYAGLSAIRYYSLLKKVDDATDIMFLNTEILPFIVSDIQTMSTGCGMGSNQQHAFMKEAFAKEKDTSLLSPTELSNIVMCGMNGDQEGQKKIYKAAMNSVVKKLP